VIGYDMFAIPMSRWQYSGEREASQRMLRVLRCLRAGRISFTISPYARARLLSGGCLERRHTELREGGRLEAKRLESAVPGDGIQLETRGREAIIRIQ